MSSSLVHLGKGTFNQLLSDLSASQQKNYMRSSRNIVIAAEPQAAGLHRDRGVFVPVYVVPFTVAAMVIDNSDSVTIISGLEKVILILLFCPFISSKENF
ncbi:hypothetical protein Aduo_002968 [Ancylostoma duodenale]